jgi:hypothetical protein
MPVHLVLQVLALVLLGLAALLEWPFSPPTNYSHSLGWAGLAVFVASTMVG